MTLDVGHKTRDMALGDSKWRMCFVVINDRAEGVLLGRARATPLVSCPQDGGKCV